MSVPLPYSRTADVLCKQISVRLDNFSKIIKKHSKNAHLTLKFREYVAKKWDYFVSKYCNFSQLFDFYPNKAYRRP